MLGVYCPRHPLWTSAFRLAMTTFGNLHTTCGNLRFRIGHEGGPKLPTQSAAILQFQLS